jgi:hypothetical protein
MDNLGKPWRDGGLKPVTKKIEESKTMGKDKSPEGSKGTHSAGRSKNALRQATDRELLNEFVRRGLIMRAVLFDPSDALLLNEILPPELGTRERQYPALGAGDRAVTNGAMGFRQRPRRRDLRERLRRTPVRQEVGDIDEDIARMSARAAKHREYVGQLLDLLSQKRLERMRELAIQGTDAASDLGPLGMLMTRTICDHLVISKREELDAGFCDIESLWAYLMNDNGHHFASSLVKWDMYMPPNLWASLIYQIIQGAAASFLNVVEEDSTDHSSESIE